MGERTRNNLSQTLKSLFRVALDSAILIYYFENNQFYSTDLMKLFIEVEKGQKIALVSVVAIHEVLVKPKKLLDYRLASLYKNELQSYPNLYIYPLTIDIAERAAELRACLIVYLIAASG